MLLGESMCSAAINVGPELTPAQLFAEAKVALRPGDHVRDDRERCDDDQSSRRSAERARCSTWAGGGGGDRRREDSRRVRRKHVDRRHQPSPPELRVRLDQSEQLVDRRSELPRSDDQWRARSPRRRDQQRARRHRRRRADLDARQVWYAVHGRCRSRGGPKRSSSLPTQSSRRTTLLAPWRPSTRCGRRAPAFRHTTRPARRRRRFCRTLVEDRRRELFLEGHRLGDLRRYNLPILPAAGARTAAGGGTYGAQSCFPLPDVERINNPNIAKGS